MHIRQGPGAHLERLLGRRVPGISQILTYQLFQQKDFPTIQIGHKTGMSESPTGMAGRSH